MYPNAAKKNLIKQITFYHSVVKLLFLSFSKDKIAYFALAKIKVRICIFKHPFECEIVQLFSSCYEKYCFSKLDNKSTVFSGIANKMCSTRFSACWTNVPTSKFCVLSTQPTQIPLARSTFCAVQSASTSSYSHSEALSRSFFPTGSLCIILAGSNAKSVRIRSGRRVQQRPQQKCIGTGCA